MVRQRQRPGAARLDRDRLDIEAGQSAGGEQRIAQQIAVVNFLHGDDGLLRRMRHGDKFALGADENIAGAVGHRRVKQDDVGRERRQQHDRIVIAERIVDDFPVRPMRQHVGADQPAQRHERHALLGGLELRVQRRAGGVEHADRAGEDRGGEARRRAEFAEADGGGLQRLDAAGADQQIRLQGRGRQRDQMQPLDAAPDQRPRRRHWHARGLSRGTASMQPSMIGARASSSDAGNHRHDRDYTAACRVGKIAVRRSAWASHRAILPTRRRERRDTHPTTFLRQRRFHIVRRQRRAADAHAGGVEHGVGDCRRRPAGSTARRRRTARFPDD